MLDVKAAGKSRAGRAAEDGFCTRSKCAVTCGDASGSCLMGKGEQGWRANETLQSAPPTGDDHARYQRPARSAGHNPCPRPPPATFFAVIDSSRWTTREFSRLDRVQHQQCPAKLSWSLGQGVEYVHDFTLVRCVFWTSITSRAALSISIHRSSQQTKPT